MSDPVCVWLSLRLLRAHRASELQLITGVLSLPVLLLRRQSSIVAAAGASEVQVLVPVFLSGCAGGVEIAQAPSACGAEAVPVHVTVTVTVLVVLKLPRRLAQCAAHGSSSSSSSLATSDGNEVIVLVAAR